MVTLGLRSKWSKNIKIRKIFAKIQICTFMNLRHIIGGFRSLYTNMLAQNMSSQIFSLSLACSPPSLSSIYFDIQRIKKRLQCIWRQPRSSGRCVSKWKHSVAAFSLAKSRPHSADASKARLSNFLLVNVNKVKGGTKGVSELTKCRDLVVRIISSISLLI